MRYYDEISSIRQQIHFEEDFVPRGGYDNIVICGMGGSAIAGMIFGDLYSKVPVSVANDYGIPDYVNNRTLFIAVSHSGNTEETLYGLEHAITKKAQIFILTSGGKISTFPGEKIIIPGDFQPRASIGYMLMPLLRTFGLVDNTVIENTVAAIEKVFDMEGEIRGIAEDMAENQRIPVVYGVPPSPSLAYRWKTQFNENSKIIAHSSAIPEMNHNELAAIPHAFLRDKFEFFVAGTPRDRHLDRVRISEEIAGLKFHRPPETDGGSIPEVFASIVYGDLVSYHVAETRGVDPRDVSAISELKKRLAEL